jgi:hypothetical protein
LDPETETRIFEPTRFELTARVFFVSPAIFVPFLYQVYLSVVPLGFQAGVETVRTLPEVADPVIRGTGIFENWDVFLHLLPPSILPGFARTQLMYSL